jgi:hypothetical protein
VRIRRLLLLGTVILGVGVPAACASADPWWPDTSGAQWQYYWSDTKYQPAGAVENVSVGAQQGDSFALTWADPDDAQPTPGQQLSCLSGTDIGWAAFQDTTAGLVNDGWESCPAGGSFPGGFLCQGGQSSCGSSLYGFLFDVIWSNDVPVVSEPLLQGISWNDSNATGGNEDPGTSSTSQYLGEQLVKVPAFPAGVAAAAIRTNVTLTGTPGDSYGTGTRTTWWVPGVGPVEVVFDHSDGSVSTGYLESTTLTPSAAPPDANYFPLKLGAGGTYRLTNSRYMRHPAVERMSVSAVSGRAATVAVSTVSGLLRVSGTYGFTANLNGITNLWSKTSSRSLVRFPKLGHGRQLLTPIDLMTYGFGPVLPAYPATGTSWSSGSARDLGLYGVTGSTTVVGVRSVRVPAGRFQALEVRSVLKQPGHPFGSGVRTMWFANGRGLVKLVFDHGDHSVTTVELVR